MRIGLYRAQVRRRVGLFVSFAQTWSLSPMKLGTVGPFGEVTRAGEEPLHIVEVPDGSVVRDGQLWLPHAHDALSAGRVATVARSGINPYIRFAEDT